MQSGESSGCDWWTGSRGRWTCLFCPPPLSGLLTHCLTGSLYHLLTAEYGLELDRADETVEAVPATSEQAALLDIPPGSALLEIRRVAWDVHGTPVEFARDFFRADRTRVHMQKYGTNWKRTVRLGCD